MASYDKFSNITVHCTNEKLGCIWKGLLKDVEEHASTCDKELLRKAIIDIQRLEGRMEMKDREIFYLKNDFAVKIDHVSNERRIRYKKEFDKIENFAVVLKEEMAELREGNKSENESLKEGADEVNNELEDVKKKNVELERQVQENKSEIDELRKELKRLSDNNRAQSPTLITPSLIPPMVISQPLTSPSVVTKVGKPFFEFAVNGKTIGRVVIDLFSAQAPLTCAKFVKLCEHTEGVGYRGCKVSYIENTWVTMGSKDHLTYTNSDKKFPPGLATPNENLSAKHDRKKLVSMSGSGGETESYFLITREPHSSFDGRRVIIGEVTEETWDVVEKIAKLPTSNGGAPKKTISIVNCGTVFD